MFLLSNFANFNPYMIKLTKTPILRNYPIAKWLFFCITYCKFCHSRIEVLKNCSVFFCVSSSCERNFEWIRRKFKPDILGYYSQKLSNQTDTTLYNPKTLEHFSIQEIYSLLICTLRSDFEVAADKVST